MVDRNDIIKQVDRLFGHVKDSGIYFNELVTELLRLIEEWNDPIFSNNMRNHTLFGIMFINLGTSMLMYNPVLIKRALTSATEELLKKFVVRLEQFKISLESGNEDNTMFR